MVRPGFVASLVVGFALAAAVWWVAFATTEGCTRSALTEARQDVPRGMQEAETRCRNAGLRRVRIAAGGVVVVLAGAAVALRQGHRTSALPTA